MYTSTSPHLSSSGWTTFVNRPQLLGNPDPAVAFPITLFICTLVSKRFTDQPPHGLIVKYFVFCVHWYFFLPLCEYIDYVQFRHYFVCIFFFICISMAFLMPMVWVIKVNVAQHTTCCSLSQFTDHLVMLNNMYHGICYFSS